jgi:recombination protein RecA
MAKTSFDADFLEIIEKKYGSHILDREKILHAKIEAIPTGSLSLDYSTGVGGIPRGRFTEIWGPEGSAKTSLCLSISKQAIELGYKVLYIEPENALDYSYIKALIGDIDESKFRLLQPKTAEQTLFMAETGIQCKDFQLIIVDSVGALAPQKEQEDDYNKDHVAIVARKLTAFLRRNAYDLRDNNIAFIFVNQVRAKIGAFRPTMDTPGGMGLKHFCAVRIRLYKSADIKTGEIKVGIYSTFTVNKNKLAPPFRTHMFPLMFGKGIDTVRDVVDFAEMLGILTKRGAYYSLDGEIIKAQGLEKTIEFLRNDKSTLDKIIERVYNTTDSTKLVRNEIEDYEEVEEDGNGEES